jgi:RND family efflux transporter MFP subunit
VAEAEAEVEAAKEGLAAAETARATQRDATARDKRLVEAKAISQEQWDHSRAADAASAARLEAARAQVEVAVKRLDQARTRLDYCRLTAPVTGVVARRLADPGDLGVPGKPLLEIVRQEKVRVRASVPPENLTDLEVGRPLTLTLGDLSVDAVVSRVFPAMGDSHLAAFEADLTSPPPGFVSGATVGVDVHLSSAEGLTVPGDALLEGERGAWVFKVADGTVHPVRVTVVDRSHDAAVVNGPLSAGEAVIVARPSRLMTFADGMKVKVAESES